MTRDRSSSFPRPLPPPGSPPQHSSVPRVVDVAAALVLCGLSAGFVIVILTLAVKFWTAVL